MDSKAVTLRRRVAEYILLLLEVRCVIASVPVYARAGLLCIDVTRALMH